jgi:hypothetical protein
MSTVHSSFKPSASFAAKCGGEVHDSCNHIFVRGAGGVIPRHPCSKQSQPHTPQAQKAFAKKTDEIEDDHHNEEVKDILNTDNPATPNRKQSLASLRGRLLMGLNDFSDAAAQNDTPRMEAILESTLSSFENYNRDRAEARIPKVVNVDKDDTITRAKRAMQLLKSPARVGKARRALEASPLYTVTSDNIHEVEAMFVDPAKALVIPDEAYTNPKFTTKLTSTFVEETLRSRDRTTARGPSGMGYDDLQNLIDEKDFIKHLTVTLNAIIAGEIGPQSAAAKRLRTARMVTLQKPNGKPRCIAIREVLVNLAFASLIRQERVSIKRLLGNQDIGFATPDGGAFPIHVLQSKATQAMLTEQNYVFISLDIINAFGTTDRQAVLDILLNRLPKLVRPFLASYGHPSLMQVKGFNDITVEEGLLQGDPAAPAYAQLVYAMCCRKAREEAPVDLMFSFFDDICVADEPDPAFAAVRALIPELAKVGLKVNLTKSCVYSTHPLSKKHMRWLKENKLAHSLNGAKYVGAPFGTDDHISAHLNKEADRVCSMIWDLTELDTVGRLDDRWADTQGLYALVQLSLNHLLRHYTRTIDPRLIAQAFQRVDDAILQLAGRLFRMMPDEFTDWRKFRLTGAFSDGGIGIIPLVMSSTSAYLGCLYRHRSLLGNDPATSVAGFVPAYERLAEFLGNEEDMPPIEDFFGEEVIAGGPRGEELGRELAEKVGKKRRQDVDARLSAKEKFVSNSTASMTCRDVFRAPISNRRYRLSANAFTQWGRVFLGLAVCPDHCGMCQKPMETDGQHGSGVHCEKFVRRRHDNIVETVSAFFRVIRYKRDFPYTVLAEVDMDSVEGVTRTPGKKALRCDLLLKHAITGDCLFYDMKVTHPNPAVPTHCKTSLGAAEAGYKQKRALYSASYPGVMHQIRPIVMDTFGGFAKDSWEELERLVRIAATTGGEVDDKLFSPLLQDLRWRLATTLARGQHAVVDHLNFRLRTHIKLDSNFQPQSSPSPYSQTSGTGSATLADRVKSTRRTISTSVGDEE